MIVKLPTGQYRLYSIKKDLRTGKRRNLGTFKTRAEAVNRERQVQYFKHLKGIKNPVKKHTKARKQKNPADKKLLQAFKIILHKYKTLYQKIKYVNKENQCRFVIEYYMIFLEGLRHDFLRLIRFESKYVPYWTDLDVTKKYGFSNETIMDAVIESFVGDINNHGSLIFGGPTVSDRRTDTERIERFMELYELLALNYKNFENEIKKCINN